MADCFLGCQETPALSGYGLRGFSLMAGKPFPESEIGRFLPSEYDMHGFFHMSFLDMRCPLKMGPEVKGEKLNVMRHIIGFLEDAIQRGQADMFPRLNELGLDKRVKPHK
jgi:hypothetical protein